jgi:hypothetical protein
MKNGPVVLKEHQVEEVTRVPGPRGRRPLLLMLELEPSSLPRVPVGPRSPPVPPSSRTPRSTLPRSARVTFLLVFCVNPRASHTEYLLHTNKPSTAVDLSQTDTLKIEEMPKEMSSTYSTLIT